MPLITSIRNRAGLLVAAIGGALVLFLLGDALNSYYFKTQSSKPSNVGVINGEEVGFAEFDTAYTQAAKQHMQTYKQDRIDDQTKTNLQDQAWGGIVRKAILRQQTEALGLGVSDLEASDMLTGVDVHPQIKQYFTNPKTGQFDKYALSQSLRQVTNTTTNDARTAAMKHDWGLLFDYIKEDRIQQKYFAMLRKGMYVPGALAKLDFSEKNNRATARIVYQDYNTLPDKDVKLSEDEMKAYYEAHKEDYKQKAGRSIEYVVWDIKPSHADSTEVRELMSKRLPAFVAAKNDSEWVNQFSDQQFDDRWLKRDEVQPQYMIDSFVKAPIGGVVGPFFDGAGFYKAVKVIGNEMRADSVKANHILLPVADGSDEAEAAARKTADSLKTLIENGANFAELAKKFSRDSASAVKGGDLGKFTYNMMVREFAKAAFGANAGQLVIAKTQFGVHLIQVVENNRTVQMYRMATLALRIDPSKATTDALFSKASAFAANHRTVKQFEEGAPKAKLDIREAPGVKRSDRAIAGFSNARELVRWMYEAKPGDVSSVLGIEDKIVVAALTEEHEDGISPFESVRKRVEQDALRSKKGDMLIAQMKNKLKGATTIDQAAQALNLPAMPANDVTFGGGYLPGLGRELKVVGTIFGLPKGKLSAPIKGERGVFLAQVDQLNVLPAPADIKDYRNQLSTQNAARIDGGEVLQALQEAAKIDDNRYLSY